ncbi:DUF1592 domain-containing protein [Candidatus Rariloculus sp.]|uniref:DUF1592 domain-containing protein n=1 Tax=Candidatus Rariloculus sp. TaxID=3101265 RepID=UPI003D0A1711
MATRYVETANRRESAMSAARVGPGVVAVLAGGGLLSGCGAPDDLTVQAEPHWGLLDEYCSECHNSTDLTAGLSFDSMQADAIASEAEVWEKVIRKLRARLMPPPGGKHPETERIDDFVAWLEATVDQAFPEPDPGDFTLHRLNRTEYANAIRDLLDLQVDPETVLPVDGSEDGFDNVASALLVTPAFIDQYLNAARIVSAQAVGNPAPRPVGVPYNISPAGQQFHVEGLPLGTRGGALIEHYFPSDGEYLLNIGDLVTGLWGFNQEHVNTLVAVLDGEMFFELDIGGGADLKVLDQIGAPAVDEINARLKNIPFVTTAGVHKVGVTFLHRSFAESDRHLDSLVPGRGQDAVLSLNLVEIFGPMMPLGISNTASRERIFACYPERPEDAATCARKIVGDLAGDAFRGLLADGDIAALMQLYELGDAAGGFEEGVKYALSGVLAHPKFLYRLESPPSGAPVDAAYPLSGIELASRLSFFLWSTIPDAEVLELAADDRLADPEVLEQQVRRMLADPRSETLASNFAFQWLGLGELDAIDPDPVVFADVDNGIRAHFIEEARLFVDSIFREDRSVLDLLAAEHTYLNETLALHYGINDIRGKRFRRVELADENRWGLLGKGGVLMVSSYPNRTSPVLRGAWLLETIIGAIPPTPPPGVEGLPDNVPGEVATTVRQRLEAHRTLPSCNGCHGVLDPLGFALENFDAVGRWHNRDREARTPIDASGVLADGNAVEGPVALREAFLARPEQFVRTFTEKLMIYGLGRSLEYGDMPTVRRIVRDSAAGNYRFSDLVTGMAASTQFRMRRPAEPETLASGATGE